MKTLVGSFLIENIFHITGRGLVLAGELRGQVTAGHQLVFDDATCCGITGVEFINLHNQQEKVGLLVDAPVTSRPELLQRGIIGATAQIVAP